MTESKDLKRWSDFQPIVLQDVNDMKSNVYFLAASVLSEADKIVGYFPGAVAFRNAGEEDPQSVGIHFTWSEDGVNWAVPTNVYPSKGFYQIHPVGMFRNRLITEEPTSVENAFKLSQKFESIDDMSKPLVLSSLSQGHQLMRTAVPYNMDIWNE
jgi:hypothetical protein